MKGVKGKLLKKLKSFSDEEKENEKENIKPPLPKRKDLGTKYQDPAAFRRPDINSSTLFDPGLLAAFREAVMDYKDKVLDVRAEEQELDVLLMDYKGEVLDVRDEELEVDDGSLMDYKGIILDDRDDEEQEVDDVSLMDYKGIILDGRDEEQAVDDVSLMNYKGIILDGRVEEQAVDDISLMDYKGGILDGRDEEQEDDDVPLMDYKGRVLDGRDEEQEVDGVPLMDYKGIILDGRDEEQEVDDVSLMEFEERCPPGWMGSVILYTTSLRGIRKTFEECNSVRFLLRSLKVMFYERDVSMHMEFREELWKVLGGRAIPPKLFIKGRYIGGADEVQGLHEQGKLRTLLKGLPVDCSNGVVCVECGGMKFLVCSSCHGSRKVYGDEVFQCLQCNENGLVLCSLCC